MQWDWDDLDYLERELDSPKRLMAKIGKVFAYIASIIARRKAGLED